MKCGIFFNAEFSFSLLLQSSWVISVELAIGPEEGISYLTDKGSTVSNAHAQLISHLTLQSSVKVLPFLE